MVIANISAEADGLMAVLNSADLRPPSLTNPLPAAEYVQSGNPPQGLRGFYKNTNNGVSVEFWCVCELRTNLTDCTSNKVQLLPNVMKPDGKPAPAMVIAFGTAAGQWDTSYNGCVVVGSAVLLHSLPFLTNEAVTKALEKQHFKLDTIVESRKGWEYLGKKTNFFTGKRAEIEAKFLKPPLNPAADPIVILSSNRLGLGSINVTDWHDYAQADQETLDAALVAISNNPKKFEVGGVETTHGVIRAFTPDGAPFIYVTAIANRLGWFPIELLPRRAAQHAAVVNNAGVVTAYLVDSILKNGVDP